MFPGQNISMCKTAVFLVILSFPSVKYEPTSDFSLSENCKKYLKVSGKCEPYTKKFRTRPTQIRIFFSLKSMVSLNIGKYVPKALKCLNQSNLHHSRAEKKLGGYFKCMLNHNLSGFLFSLT